MKTSGEPISERAFGIIVLLSYAIGGGRLAKLLESVILTTGPNLFAATSELNKNGMKCPLLL